MTHPIRILHIEDDLTDSELVRETLQGEGLACDVVRVADVATLRAALKDASFDIVLSDHTLPGFSGTDALREVTERRPGLPFVFVSGSMGEDYAIELLRSGATDYVLKHRLTRLGPAVRRALAEADERRRRREAEAALRDSHRFLERILSTTPAIVYVYELESGRVAYPAGEPAAVQGYPLAALAAPWRPASRALLGEEPAALERHRQVLRDARDGEVAAGELRVRHGDGSWCWLQRREVVFSRSAEGRVHEILGTALDVTERRQNEERLLRNQRLENLGTLAGGIAHDLNNVLSPILMSIEILRRRLPKDDERSRKLLERVEASAQRGSGMVGQILAFARGAEGQRRTLEPARLVAEIAGFTRETFPRSIEIIAETQDEPWTVEGDATQLHQVLLNLCVNARDAMRDGGRLRLAAENVSLDAEAARRIHATGAGPYVVLSVADTGTGIAPGLRERIFEPFFTTKETEGGTGLGLATSLGIVKSHGGAILVDSEPGRGTTFRVYLPAAAGAVAGAAAAEPEELPGGHGEWILVVDDESSILELTRETLESVGYRVQTAGDGAEALVIYKRGEPQVAAVITDLAMPVLDGSETVRALRELNPELPILVSTGASGSPVPPNVEVLLKPYTAGALLTALRRVLGSG